MGVLFKHFVRDLRDYLRSNPGFGKNQIVLCNGNEFHGISRIMWSNLAAKEGGDKFLALKIELDGSTGEMQEK